jgi:hypothetical protein
VALLSSNGCIGIVEGVHRGLTNPGIKMLKKKGEAQR